MQPIVLELRKTFSFSIAAYLLLNLRSNIAVAQLCNDTCVAFLTLLWYTWGSDATAQRAHRDRLYITRGGPTCRLDKNQESTSKMSAVTFDERAYLAEVYRHYGWNFAVNMLDVIFYFFGIGFISTSTILPLYVGRLTDSR